MDENQKPDPEYLKGFNEGYIVAKYLPDTSDKIAESLGSSPRSDGFKDGWKEYQSEKFKEKLPDWFKTEPKIQHRDPKSKDNDKDKG